MAKSLVEMAAELVQAQCSTTSNTFNALQALQLDEARGVAAEGVAAKAPAMSPEKSIQKSKIVCLECGEEFKMLSPKHLRSHGLTGKEYRKKYGFAMRQPLCAKMLSDRRKKAGKERGLPENLRKVIDQRKKGAAGKKGAKKK